MLHRLILKVTKFQLPPPKRLSTVVKNILGAMPPPSPCQIGLRSFEAWVKSPGKKTHQLLERADEIVAGGRLPLWNSLV